MQIKGYDTNPLLGRLPANEEATDLAILSIPMTILL